LLAEVLGALADTDLTSDQRLASIEKIIRDRFDIAVVARLALGKGKSRFSGPQEASYQCEFEPYLSNYIGSRFDRYQQEKVEIFEVTQMKRDVIVSTRILGGIHDRAILDFRMRESSGRWLAVDVKFEGMSVLKSLHAQFTEVLSAGGPDHLVRSLGEKNGSRSDC
jgi:ABC-type transporter MlaC component